MRYPSFLFHLCCLVLISVFIDEDRALKAQDLQGGTGIFTTRPVNPSVRSTTRPQKENSKSVNDASRVAIPKKESPKEPPRAEMKEAIEDALTLGNSARDAKPPRYEDAELAYKLAAKLSPTDPRPYIGLGNTYYDQKKYEEAAKAYKEALRLGQKSALIGVILGGALPSKSGVAIGAAIGSGVYGKNYAELHSYLGNILSHQEKWAEAEVEFKTALLDKSSRNGQLYASLGYALYKQKKYSEATTSFEKALSLEPQNTIYKGLLEKVIKDQRK